MYSTAEKAQSEAEQMRSEYTERLSKAKEEAAEIVGTATRRAAERSDEILRESSQQASAMVKKAERVIEQERINSAVTSERRSQVGTGMRNERIRTYNFPQGRVTDHRIGLTLYKIDAIMDGDLDELIDALVTADQAKKLQSQQEG